MPNIAIGSGAWIRTKDIHVNSVALYHSTTPEFFLKTKQAPRGSLFCIEALCNVNLAREVAAIIAAIIVGE